MVTMMVACLTNKVLPGGVAAALGVLDPDSPLLLAASATPFIISPAAAPVVVARNSRLDRANEPSGGGVLSPGGVCSRIVISWRFW